MVRVFSALPARPLHGRPPTSVAGVLFGLFGLLTVGAIVGYFAVFLPAGLVSDWQVRSTARMLRDGAVTNSDCSGRDLIEICNLTVSAPVGTGTVHRRVHYLFISPQAAPFVVQAVADPSRPGTLTTDLALDWFWNRVASFLAGLFLFTFLLVAASWGVWRSHRRTQAWRTEDSVAVKLQLVSRQRVRNGEIWTVRSEDGHQERWPAPRRAAPFVLGAADEILGLQRTVGKKIMPLDDKLRWVDLSPPERASILG